MTLSALWTRKQKNPFQSKTEKGGMGRKAVPPGFSSVLLALWSHVVLATQLYAGLGFCEHPPLHPSNKTPLSLLDEMGFYHLQEKILLKFILKENTGFTSYWKSNFLL